MIGRAGIKLVGASGFEPPTSWSRTIKIVKEVQSIALNRRRIVSDFLPLIGLRSGLHSTSKSETTRQLARKLAFQLQQVPLGCTRFIAFLHGEPLPAPRGRLATRDSASYWWIWWI